MPQEEAEEERITKPIISTGFWKKSGNY